MRAIFNIATAVTAYSDPSATNNPFLKHVDWRRNTQGLQLDNPESKTYEVAPGATLSIFDATRTLGVDGTTAFSLALNTVNGGSIYRLTFTGGTDPVFRTARAVDLTAIAITVTVNNNATIQFQAGSGTPFSAIQVGDVVFVPDATTGDAQSPFNVMNVGFWYVLSRTGTTLICRRQPGTLFQGINEVVTPASAPQFRAFSVAGIQVGDKLEIAGGFTSASWATYEIQTVTATFLEFVSTEPLALETGILPGASGLVCYHSGKKYIRVECDQEANVWFNGESSNGSGRVAPIVAGDFMSTGWREQFGVVYTLNVKNRSQSATMKVVVISGE